MHNYTIKKLLDKKSFDNALETYESLPAKKMQQDHALYYIEKRYPASELMRSRPSVFAFIDDYMKINYNQKRFSHYFLRYDKWSFARVHTDDVTQITNTVITLLDQSKDLIGGETLVWDKFYQLPVLTPKHTIKGKEPKHRDDLVPCSPILKIGESLIYDGRTSHGVTQVEQGHRIVLVSWYTTPKNS